MRIGLMSVLLGSLALPMMACSSDDSSGSGGSKLDADKQVSRLDETEQQVLKTEIEETFEASSSDVIDAVCTIVGITSEALDSSTTCEAAAAECVTDANSSSDTDDVSDSDFEAAALNCDVTVGELLECMQDLVDSFAQYAQGITCDSALEDLGEPPAEPASCSFTAQCSLADEYATQLDELENGGN